MLCQNKNEEKKIDRDNEGRITHNVIETKLHTSSDPVRSKLNFNES